MTIYKKDPVYTVQISAIVWKNLCYDQAIWQLKKLIEAGAILGLQVTVVEETTTK